LLLLLLQAFEKAWQKACSSNVPIVLVVPSQNTYLVKPIVFRGPCKSKVTVQIDGTIEAPSDPSDYNGHESNWLMFENINDLVVQGGGTINGNGNSWWKLSCNIDTSLVSTTQ
jgi:polygalacturonase